MGRFTQSITGLNDETQDQTVTVENFGGGLFESPAEMTTDFLQIDGDTWTDPQGNKYRLAGAAAPEATRVDFSDRGDLQVDHGEPGGDATTIGVNKIMREGGFNRVIRTGEQDQYGREIIRITNDQGQDLTQTLYRSGALKPHAKFGTPEATDEYEFGLFERSLGGVNEYEEVVNELEEARQSGLSISDLTGIPNFAPDAVNEAEYARGAYSDYHNRFGGVEFRNPDRDLENMANNSIGASFDLGWQGLKEGAYGFLELAGFTEAGEEGLKRLEYEKQRLPGIRNIDFDDVGGVSDFFQYLGNNAAMSIPYMGLIAGGAIAAAPLGLAGAAIGAAPIAAVYAGQTWNEMEGEKSAGAALAAGVASAALDRLGLAGLVKPSQFFTKEGREILVKQLAQRDGITEDAARATLLANEKAVGKELAKHMGEVSDAQLIAKTGVKDLITESGKGLLKGGVSEAATEAGQETIQYVTATEFSDRQFDEYELYDRIRDAALAGGTLGAGFGTAGAGWQYGDRYAAQKDLEAADIERLSAYEQVREDRRRAGKQINTVEGILENTREESADWQAEQSKLREDYRAAKEEGKKYKGDKTRLGSFAARARKHQAENRGIANKLSEIRSLPEAIAKGIGGVKKLYQAASVTAFDPQELANKNYGETLSDIRALVGQQRGVINSGLSFEAHKDRIYGTIGSMMYIPNIMNRFGLRDQAISKKNRNKVSSELREFGKFAAANNLDINNIQLHQVPEHLRANFAALKETAKELENMANAIYKVQNDAVIQDGGEGFGYLQGWWWKNQSFDAGKVKKNKLEWFDWMRQNTELNEEQLRDMYDRLESGQINTLDDYFSHVGGVEFIPGSQKSRTANLSETEGFQKFAQEDIFANLDAGAQSAARFATNRKYWGSGGKNLDYLFDKLEKQGMAPEKVDEVAWYVKSIIDAESGNFNRIDNYNWATVQRSVSTWAILAGLPLSALSSFPELAMVGLGLDMNEVSKAASNVGKEVADAYIEQAKRLADDAIKNDIILPMDREGNPVPKEQARLDKAGLLWTPSSAANRLGVGETNITNAWVQDTFFKTITLTQLTQGQRRANGAIVSDFVGNRLAELSSVPDRTQLNTRQQHVWNQLAELGLDVDRMLDLWDEYGNSNTLLDYAETNREVPADIMEEIDSQMQLAVYNFVNARIQNPGAANRPLFFQDPHYQLLTQFNGFISTFTANVVPKLWNDYIKNGPPAVKYKTFALMMSMMALGAGGQYLKDWIKYGRTSPYLEDWQLMQRAIYSSGVLGQGERIADVVLPLYGGRPRSTSDWLIDLAVGEAGPSVRNIGALAEAGFTLADEGPAEAAQKLGKVAPGIAPLGRFRRGLVGSLFGEGQEQFHYYDDK